VIPEEQMVELLQDALRQMGIDDEILAAGEFEPRGEMAGAFAGGLIGGEIGGVAGGMGDAVGTVGGFFVGRHAADAASGLPSRMLVGVSEGVVYGFAATTRHTPPSALVFRVPREGLTVKVHQRVNVRVLELIHEESGSRIELEGNRIPVTHSKDVIQALS
jgi:hypothetical protein